MRAAIVIVGGEHYVVPLADLPALLGIALRAIPVRHVDGRYVQTADPVPNEWLSAAYIGDYEPLALPDEESPF